MQLARLLRAGELTAVWVPDEGHEAIRELVRARDAAVDDLRRKRQSISLMMLRYGRTYPGKRTWGARHRQWLQAQRFGHPAQQRVLLEMTHAAQHALERLQRVDAAIVEFLLTWSLAPVVEALQALRGVQLVTAATIMVEIGDLRRFENPRQLMAYLGLVPGERSTGDSVQAAGDRRPSTSHHSSDSTQGRWNHNRLVRLYIFSDGHLA